MAAGQTRENRRDVSHAERQRRREPKASDDALSLLYDGVPRLLQVGQDSLAARLELQSGLGRADAAGRPGEKAYTQLLLKSRNPSAYDGLRNAEALRGAVEAAAL